MRIRPVKLARSATSFVSALFVASIACGCCAPPDLPIQPLPPVVPPTVTNPDAGVPSEDAGARTEEDGGSESQQRTVIVSRHLVRHGPDGGELSRTPITGLTIVSLVVDGGMVRLDDEIDGGVITFEIPPGGVYVLDTFSGLVQSSLERIDLDEHHLGRESPTAVVTQSVPAQFNIDGSTPMGVNDYIQIAVPGIGANGIIRPIADGGATYLTAGRMHVYAASTEEPAFLSEIRSQSSPYWHFAAVRTGWTSSVAVAPGGVEVLGEVSPVNLQPVSVTYDQEAFAAQATRLHAGASIQNYLTLSGEASFTVGDRIVGRPVTLFGAGREANSLDGISFSDALPQDWTRLVTVYGRYAVPAPGADGGTSSLSVLAGTRSKLAWGAHLEPHVDPPTQIEVGPIDNSRDVEVLWQADPRSKLFHLELWQIVSDGQKSHTGSHNIATERTQAVLPRSWLDSGGRYFVKVTAFSAAVESPEAGLAPLAMPVEVGYAEAVSEPFVAN